MKGPFYLCSPDDILKIKGRQRILISSSQVSLSVWNKSDIQDAMREMDLTETFIEQPLRGIRPGLSIGGKEEGLKLWVAKDFLRKLSRTRGMISLAVDAWLEWGKKHRKANVVVIGGGLEASDHSTSIDIMSFEEGVLKKVRQVAIQPRDSANYADELSDLIYREMQGDAQIEREVHISELLMPTDGNTQIQPNKIIPKSFIERIRLSPINFGFQRISAADFVLPGSLVLLAMAYGASQVLVHRAAFQSAKAEFQQQVIPVKEAYAAGEGALSLLQAKQQFMTKPNPVTKKAQELERLFSAITRVQGIAVTGIALPAEQSAYEGLVMGITDMSPESDFFMQLAIRESPEKSVLEQTEPLMREMTRLVGGTMKLHGMSRESSQVDTVRIRGLTIEGNFPAEESPEGESEEGNS